jgi:ribosomal protein L6P/L9E
MPMVTHFLLYSLFLKTVSGYLQGYKQQLHLKGRGLKATLFERSLLFKLERSNKIIFTLPSNLQVNIIKFQSINFISTNY